MKKKTILPVGLKGNQINERMKELMGISSINENSSKVVVELTKTGPDGKSYAIIRENHEWYIKKTDKISNILAEDFKYIGGLKNKKDEAYPSYAKAIKHLNLKFKSLAEAYGFEGEINVFENDNLISESGLAGFSSEGGSGFSGEGNLEGNTPMFESEDEPKRSECCDAPIVNGDICSECKEHTGGLDEVEMSEAEKAVDAMLERENSDKEFAALAEPKDKITYADKIAGAKKNELNEEDAASLNGAIIALITVGGTAATYAILKGREALQKLAQRQDKVGQAADYVLSFMGGATSRLGEIAYDENIANTQKNEMSESEMAVSLDASVVALITAGGAAAAIAVLKGREALQKLAQRQDKIGRLADNVLSFMGGVSSAGGLGEELFGNQDRLDVNKNGEIEADDLAMLRNMNESRFSIKQAVETMDDLIHNLTEGLKKKL